MSLKGLIKGKANRHLSDYNFEDSTDIICPYCGEHYPASYEDTYIGGECVDCYTTDTEEYTCDMCGKTFTMYGYQGDWMYHTETIDGQVEESEDTAADEW